MERLRVLIGDDHPVFRDGLRGILEALPDVDIVGEAASGDEVVSATAERQPDVVIMNLRMPQLNGIEATRRIVQTSPHVGVLVRQRGRVGQ